MVSILEPIKEEGAVLDCVSVCLMIRIIKGVAHLFFCHQPREEADAPLICFLE